MPQPALALDAPMPFGDSLTTPLKDAPTAGSAHERFQMAAITARHHEHASFRLFRLDAAAAPRQPSPAITSRSSVTSASPSPDAPGQTDPSALAPGPAPPAASSDRSTDSSPAQFRRRASFFSDNHAGAEHHHVHPAPRRLSLRPSHISQLLPGSTASDIQDACWTVVPARRSPVETPARHPSWQRRCSVV